MNSGPSFFSNHMTQLKSAAHEDNSGFHHFLYSGKDGGDINSQMCGTLYRKRVTAYYISYVYDKSF